MTGDRLTSRRVFVFKSCLPKLRNIPLLLAAQPFGVCDLRISNLLALECLPHKPVIDAPASAPRLIKINKTQEKEKEIEKKETGVGGIRASGEIFYLKQKLLKDLSIFENRL